MSSITAGTSAGTALIHTADTTGSFVVKTGAGSTTGLTVDGSQIVTLANPLPVASGGTGTTSAAFVNLTTNVTGTLPIANGGTGTTSTTFVNAATNVTGTLPIANGGTNSTATATAGGAGYGTGTAHAYTAAGTVGQYLQSNGASAPTWATVSAGVGDHEIVVTSGNGHGSTNTKIRRYTTTQSSVGSAITYADSASNGASFTINSAGIYAITTRDASSTSAPQYGISLNSTQLTTNIQNITAANRLCFYIPYSTNCPADITVVVSLAVNDVIRPHNDGSADNTTATYVGLRIRKIGSI